MADITERIDTYIVESRWGDRLNFECRVCPFADLDRGAARRHAATHIVAGQPTGLLDPHGSAILAEPAIDPTPQLTQPGQLGSVVTEPGAGLTTDSDLARLTRVELDDLARSMGVNPAAHPNKGALIEALTTHQEDPDHE